MKYRPLAPDDLDRTVGNLRRLMDETILPWQFDPKGKQFYVEVDGKRHAVTFGNGDAETQIVELVTANLPMLLDAIERNFVLIDREWVCKPRKNDLPGLNEPATKNSLPAGETSPSAPFGSMENSAKPLPAPLTKSTRKRRAPKGSPRAKK